MKIDLTKKPEGATHINPHSGLWVKCFGGNSGSYQFFKDGEWEMGFGCMSNSYLEIAKPEPWTGKGLPPVGTVCEFQHRNAPNGLWFPTTIRYSSHAYIVYTDSIEDCEACWEIQGPCAIEFRPIRTPEQIAAEERKQAISEMVYGACECDPGDGTTTAFILCGLIYDAGYRKQSAP